MLLLEEKMKMRNSIEYIKTKIKEIFIRSRKGEAITEDKAKYCLKIAKHIESLFKNE